MPAKAGIAFNGRMAVIHFDSRCNDEGQVDPACAGMTGKSIPFLDFRAMTDKIPLLHRHRPRRGRRARHPDGVRLAGARNRRLGIAAGNVGLEHTVRNALCCAKSRAEDVPVFAGCPAPLLHPALDAAFVHGHDGFGDTGYAPAARRRTPNTRRWRCCGFRTNTPGACS